MKDEMVIEIEVERLRGFKNHPFKVKEDEDMLELEESIKQYGILVPLVVRPIPDGKFEIISGHRRKIAAARLGYRKVPVIIRNMDDNEAIIGMVDSNLHRDHITFSEKAFAYKMKYDAIRKSRKEMGSQLDPENRGKKTVDVMSSQSPDSPKQIQRYIKLTELIPEVMKLLDEGTISFNPAVEIAFLQKSEQKKLLNAMEYTQAIPSLSQAQRIKRLSQEKEFTQEKVENILSEVKKGEIDRVIFKNEQLYRFFPKTYTPSQMKREILEILKIYMERYM